MARGCILALFIGCIATPCYRPVLQVGRRPLACDNWTSRASWRILALLSACIAVAEREEVRALPLDFYRTMCDNVPSRTLQEIGL